MSSLSKELVFLILQFLEEEEFKESVHKLEKESRVFFNMKYFGEKVQAGEWDEVEKYLAGFTRVNDNRSSMKIFFEIRKQKYLEALDRKDKAKALEILENDLKVFSRFIEGLYQGMTQLLTLSNFRENEQLSNYGDTKTARSIMLIELKTLIEANPLFCDKLAFPTLKSSGLQTLINQSDSETIGAVVSIASVVGKKMSSLSRELVFLILQFLDEEKFKESIHKLEKESGVFFNMKYFEEKVKGGEWDEVEKYLAGFTKVDDNRYSVKIFFEIRKQKYLEALDRKDKAKALEILETDLKVFSTFNEGLYQEMTQLLTLRNFRENEQLSKYGDTKTARSIMWIELKQLIEANSLFCDKLAFPTLNSSTLRTIVNKSLNPDIKTLFTDHSCTPTNGPLAPTPVNLPVAANAGAGAGANAAAANAGTGASSVQASVVTASSMPVLQNQVSGLKHPRTPPATPGTVDYKSPDHEQLLKRPRPAPSVEENAVDPSSKNMEKPRTMDDVNVIEKTKPWQLAKIAESGQFRLLTLPARTRSSSKVVRLLYTNFGVGILALGSSGIQNLWERKHIDQDSIQNVRKWLGKNQNPSRKATASVAPSLCQRMTNDISGVNLEEAVPCIALSKNGEYVMSATGGKVSMFNMKTFNVMETVMPPPPASTYLAFHPQDDNIIAIGMEDSTIHIYDVRGKEVKSNLKGHHKRITGLAFSSKLNILVSSGADAQLSVWSFDTWVKRESVAIQIPVGKAPNGDTRVHFHSNQIHMLVVHETQLAIYDASKMERIRQWVPQDVLSAPISCATYSCNSQLVHATFCDGNIGVFDADTLRLRCHIAPTSYLSQAVLNGQAVYPLVVAAHPLKSNQFAVGLTDGTVKVLEPLEPQGKWGVSPPGDNGMLNGRTTLKTVRPQVRSTYSRRKGKAGKIN